MSFVDEIYETPDWFCPNCGAACEARYNSIETRRFIPCFKCNIEFEVGVNAYLDEEVYLE